MLNLYVKEVWQLTTTQLLGTNGLHCFTGNVQVITQLLSFDTVLYPKPVGPTLLSFECFPGKFD